MSESLSPTRDAHHRSRRFQPERIQIDDDFGLSPMATPHVNVGDSLGDVTGVMSYGFGNYEVRFTEKFRRTPAG